tara:strand:+ start:980 stop:1888 length:909 start_codon:yes stop_codon:yes gene_type:complete
MASFGTRAPRRVTGDWHRRGKRLNRNTFELPILPDELIDNIFSQTEQYGCTDINIEFDISPPSALPGQPVGGWGNIVLKSTRDNTDLHVQILKSFIRKFLREELIEPDITVNSIINDTSAPAGEYWTIINSSMRFTELLRDPDADYFTDLLTFNNIREILDSIVKSIIEQSRFMLHSTTHHKPVEEYATTFVNTYKICTYDMNLEGFEKTPSKFTKVFNSDIHRVLKQREEQRAEQRARQQFGKKSSKPSKPSKPKESKELKKLQHKAKKIKVRITKNVRGKRKYLTVNELKKKLKKKLNKK